jgi:hypothetical protein
MDQQAYQQYSENLYNCKVILRTQTPIDDMVQDPYYVRWSKGPTCL